MANRVVSDYKQKKGIKWFCYINFIIYFFNSLYYNIIIKKVKKDLS